MIRTMLAAVLAACSLQAFAESKPIPMPADTKLVSFSFDSNNTYTILARPRNITDITLHKDEEIVAMALGDTVQWMVNDAPGHVFIKPLHPDIVTSATLVTTKRTYQLSLRSSPENGKFYQRVAWDYPDLIVLRTQQAARVKATVDMEKARLDATVISPGLAVEDLNFNYAIEGDPEWKPSQVFDNGKFTWLRLRKSQDMPAVFALGDDDKAELVNTNIRGEYMIVQRILPKILLKLGKTEVKVTNRKLQPDRGWFSGGD
jgi:type IV secretion system protein VirB9